MGFLADVKESLAYARIDESRRGGSRICPDCGAPGDGILVNRGHFLVELLVWGAAVNWGVLVFPPVLALAFSIWRRTGRSCRCELCGGRMIPISSPRGKSLMEQYKSSSQ